MDQMGINLQQRTPILEILASMCYARSEEDCNRKLEALEAAQCAKLLAYFYANWHNIRGKWVQGLQRTTTLGNQTNNRAETINQKIMQVVLRYESLPQLFKDLMVINTSLCTKRDERAMVAYDEDTHFLAVLTMNSCSAGSSPSTPFRRCISSSMP